MGDADIKSCFDNIPYENVLKKLYQLCGDKELVAVVRTCIKSQPGKFRPGGEGRGLPQGMVLSPFLCNLYLHDLDLFFSFPRSSVGMHEQTLQRQVFLHSAQECRHMHSHAGAWEREVRSLR